ncbi:carbon-nitrogen hydrolase family protein [Candidatus Bathyarchaeota archaeon]|nr:MAG: carbon-nitrogen hydrolase family protein [Candidatus Bathyarchaeota archaeon]
MKINVALVQFSRGPNKQKNVERMCELLKKIHGSKIVCLPEAWVGKALILEEEDVKYILSSLGEIASQNSFYLFLGGFFMKRGGKIVSSCYLINDKGEVEGFSDKLFPSMAVGERFFSDFGEISNIFNIEGINVGVVICVDAMYPEIVRNLALKGAKIIFNPSNIPESRIELWKHIGVTRAAENTIFYVFVNNTYTTYPDGRIVLGKSFVASPNGEIIFQANSSENYFQVEIDLSLIDKVRERWPYLSDIKEFWKEKF